MVNPKGEGADDERPLAPPESGKTDPEAAQRAEDDTERLRGGLDKKAVAHAREELERLRERNQPAR